MPKQNKVLRMSWDEFEKKAAERIVYQEFSGQRIVGSIGLITTCSMGASCPKPEYIEIEVIDPDEKNH